MRDETSTENYENYDDHGDGDPNRYERISRGLGGSRGELTA